MSWLSTNWQTACAAFLVALAAAGLLWNLCRHRRNPTCAACRGCQPAPQPPKPPAHRQ